MTAARVARGWLGACALAAVAMTQAAPLRSGADGDGVSSGAASSGAADLPRAAGPAEGVPVGSGVLEVAAPAKLVDISSAGIVPGAGAPLPSGAASGAAADAALPAVEVARRLEESAAPEADDAEVPQSFVRRHRPQIAAALGTLLLGVVMFGVSREYHRRGALDYKSSSVRRRRRRRGGRSRSGASARGREAVPHAPRRDQGPDTVIEERPHSAAS